MGWETLKMLVMNLIDHYNSAQSPLASHSPQPQQQWMHHLHPKPSEQAFPNYLIFMRAHFENQYPNASVSIFSSNEGGQLVVGVLHSGMRWGRWVTYNEVVIDPRGQSVVARGVLLLNNQLARIGSRQQVVMALRKAGNINQRISPLRIAINPFEGTVELVSCCYVDSKFTLLGHSQKNMEYFTSRIGFLVNLIYHQMGILLYLQEDDSLKLYSDILAHPLLSHQRPLSQSIREGEMVLARLQNSLWRVSIHSPADPLDSYRSKVDEIQRHPQSELHQSVQNMLKVFECDSQLVQYSKPIQLTRLYNETYEDSSVVQELTTDLERLLKFRVYSKIQLKKPSDWQLLSDHGGNGTIEIAQAKFTLLPPPHSKELQTKIARKSVVGSNKVKRELNLVRELQSSSHPNIMTFFEPQSDDGNFIYSVFEENQSLQCFLKKCETLSFIQKVFMLEQAAKGLLFLHQHNILHLDFKPANVLVGRKHLVKVCDFGESCRVSQLAQHTFFGTFPYAPPEFSLRRHKIPLKLDVYSLGVSIYRCLFTEHIWDSIASKTSFLLELQREELVPTLLPERFQEFSCRRVASLLAQLCLRCVSSAPEHRPTLSWVITFLHQAQRCLKLLHYH